MIQTPFIQIAATFHPADLVIVVVYLLGIVALGLWSARREKATANEYFLAGRNLRWPVIGLSLFATNISTVHLVGLAQSGYSHGLVYGNFEWLAAFCLILLGLVFAPFYFRNRVATLPEYLERRFSGGSRTMLAVMAVFGALFIHIGVSLYAGATIIEGFFGLNVYVSIILISAATTLYTVVGGLLAVVVTEAVQTVLLLAGAFIITLLGVMALGDAGVHDWSAFKAATKPDQLSMVHADGGFAWYAMLLGYPVLGVWYWCADQTIVQRVLGARTERDAMVGPLFAGIIKVLPVFLMVFPGVMAYVLFKDVIGEQPDQTLPVLIDQLVPTGLKGLLAAGLLAALMSTVAGALNSASTLVSIDIVKRLRPDTPEHTLVRIGRITAVAVMVLAIAWSTQGKSFGGIFDGLNQMIACLAPPITAVFILGVFWPRGTKQAALATLSGGFLLGIVAFVLDFPAISKHLFGQNAQGQPVQFITHTLGIPFMLQAWWLCVICGVLFVAVSLATPRPAPEQTEGLCWKNPLAAVFGSPITGGWRDPRVLAAGLTVVMLALYWVFR
ncbi:MAG: sodium:solute symporter [Phycisphaerales bacterium JB063]